MWYKNSYRRHLIDMHINDWSDEFLSQFNPSDYLLALKKAKIQNAMIYLQSHVGLCYFPTKIGVMHKAFVGKEDTIKTLIDLCHKEGISVTTYYSLNYNTVEHDRHKDWRMVNENGYSRRDGGITNDSQNKNLLFASTKDARYGLCCPNNHDYRDFTFKQIDEMLVYTGKIEGVFFDMPFWAHTCYCEHCRKRFKAETGFEMPTVYDFSDTKYQLLMQKKAEWMAEWTQAVTDYVKAISPDLSVEHNFATAIAGDTNSGIAEGVCASSDFVGGDLYGGILPHSFSCKFFKNITKNMPFDYMFTRCKPGLTSHTLIKTDDEIRTEIFMNVAHNGATLVIDAIDPVGTMDLRVYDKLGNIIAEEIPYEKYLDGKMVEDVGLYFSLMSKFNPHGESFNNKSALIAVSDNFIKNKIPFGVTGNFCDLDGYKLLVMPLFTSLEKDNERILNYVKNGGNLYLSGVENPELLFALTGLKNISRTVENNVYLAPTIDDGFMYFNKKYPLPFDGTAPIVFATKDVEVLATLTLPYTKPDDINFASIHSNPPGIATDHPIIIKTKYGKGNVIWSGVPIEAVNMYEYNVIFNNLLASIMPDYAPSFKSNAPDSVEITLFKDDLGFRLNAINVLEVPFSRIGPDFTVSVKTGKEPKKVALLPSETAVPFEFNDGYTTFTVKNFKIFEMFRIEV